MKDAVTELEGLIRDRYPDAAFRVVRSPDEGRAIHLLTTVALVDLEEVMDVVVDRMMQLQIEDKLPLQVVPVRPRQLTEKLVREQRLQPHRAADVPEDIRTRLA
jgi:hypothetical protein